MNHGTATTLRVPATTRRYCTGCCQRKSWSRLWFGTYCIRCRVRSIPRRWRLEVECAYRDLRDGTWQFLCPTCFVRLHEIASGRVLIWSLRADEAANTEDALYSWQQTAEAAEMELAVLRGMVAQAEKVVDSFDRRPTENCARDVIGLAERLSRYRQMRDGTPPQIGPGSRQGAIPRV